VDGRQVPIKIYTINPIITHMWDFPSEKKRRYCPVCSEPQEHKKKKCHECGFMASEEEDWYYE